MGVVLQGRLKCPPVSNHVLPKKHLPAEIVPSTLQKLHAPPFRVCVTFRDLTELENRDVLFPTISSALVSCRAEILLRTGESVEMRGLPSLCEPEPREMLGKVHKGRR